VLILNIAKPQYNKLTFQSLHKKKKKKKKNKKNFPPHQKKKKKKKKKTITVKPSVYKINFYNNFTNVYSL
jgi:hypothetical protein